HPPNACAAGPFWPDGKRLILNLPPVSSAMRATNFSSNFCGVVPPSQSACILQVTDSCARTIAGAARLAPAAPAARAVLRVARRARFVAVIGLLHGSGSRPIAADG